MFSSYKNISYYKILYKKHGICNKSIGWNRDNQDLRFKSLISQLHSIGNLGNVIDIGAGFADFYFFLKNCGVLFESYTGFEIVEPFYEFATKRLEKINNANLLNEDFLGFFGNADTIVASGIFGMGSGSDMEMIEYFEKVTSKSCNVAKKAIAFNFLSANSTIKSSNKSFQPNIKHLVDIVSKYSKRYVFDHSYSPYEFTLTIFVDQTIDNLLWFET